MHLVLPVPEIKIQKRRKRNEMEEFCMGEVIVITSGKGGVGKTTTTANIGAGLAQMGKKVIVIDTDLGLRNLDVV